MSVNYKINATADNVNGTVYYPDFNLTIDNLSQYAIECQSSYEAKGKNEKGGIFRSSFELEFTFDIGKRMIYVQRYFSRKAYRILRTMKK